MGKTIKHCEDITNSLDGIQLLAERNIDGITYDTVKRYSISKVGQFDKFLLDENGNYFYQIYIDGKNRNIIDNIIIKSSNPNIKITYHHADKTFLPTDAKKFVLCAGYLGGFTIKITFLTIPKPDDTFELSLRTYLFSTKNRNPLVCSPLGLKCDNIWYRNGIVNITNTNTNPNTDTYV